MVRNTAIVTLASEKTSGTQVAIKKMKLVVSGNAQAPIINEISILQAFTHKNIVKFNEAFQVKYEIWITMEYMDGGSLYNLLGRQKSLPQTIIAKIAFEILNGLKYLHDRGIIHRDIKSGNILIDLKGLVKIGNY
jgi:serine/threonine protein kinase